MNRRLAAIWLTAMGICVSNAVADGIEMTRDYHFTSGTRLTIRLSDAQISQLEAQRKGEARLYLAVVTLTPDQTQWIHSRTGRTVTELNVFEQAWSDCGCCAWSIASRFAPDRLEVTSEHLTDTVVLQARALGLELLKKRREHWWQFWRHRYRKDSDAFERALSLLKARSEEGASNQR